MKENLPNPDKQESHKNLLRGFAQAVLGFTRAKESFADFLASLYPLEIHDAKNLENLDPEAVVIFASNHTAVIDPFIIRAALHKLAQKNPTLAQIIQRHWIIPISANYAHAKGADRLKRVVKLPAYYLLLWLGKVFGAELIPVPQTKPGEEIPKNSRNLISTFFQQIKESASKDPFNLLIFPEGTRTPQGKIGEFKSGIERIATGVQKQQREVLILPIGITYPDPNPDTPQGARLDILCQRKNPIQVHFGSVINPANEDQLSEKLRDQIANLAGIETQTAI